MVKVRTGGGGTTPNCNLFSIWLSHVWMEVVIEVLVDEDIDYALQS